MLFVFYIPYSNIFHSIFQYITFYIPIYFILYSNIFHFIFQYITFYIPMYYILYSNILHFIFQYISFYFPIYFILYSNKLHSILQYITLIKKYRGYFIIFTVVPCILILLKFFTPTDGHIFLKEVLKFTLKQFQHVSV